MTSRDFGFLTLRNTLAYQPNGDPVPANYIFITSSSGAAIFSNNVTIDVLNASTINASTINTDTLNASTINASTISASTISASTISADVFNVSTLNASTIVIDVITTSTINVITLNTSTIFTSSIFTNYLTVNSTAIISTLNATNINASTINLLTLNTSSIFTNYLTVNSTTIISTLNATNINASTINLLTLNTSSIFTSSLLTSSLLTSSIITNYLTVNSTAIISTLNALNFTISSSGGINRNNSNSTIIGGPSGNIQLYGNEIYASSNLNITGTAISRVSISTITSDPGQSTDNWLNLFGKYCFVSSGIVSTITLPLSLTPLTGSIIIIRNTGAGLDPPIAILGAPSYNTGTSTFVGKTSSYVYVNGLDNNTTGWYSL
jgi:hypothetical protein